MLVEWISIFCLFILCAVGTLFKFEAISVVLLIHIVLMCVATIVCGIMYWGVESGICSDLNIVQTVEKDHFAKASPSPVKTDVNVHEEAKKTVSEKGMISIAKKWAQNASLFFCLAPVLSFPFNPG